MDNSENHPRTINDFRESLGLPRFDDPHGEKVFDTAWTPAKLENGWTGVVGATVTDGEVELHGAITAGSAVVRRSATAAANEAVDIYERHGIITHEEAEAERIKIGERFPAKPGDDDYVEPMPVFTGRAAMFHFDDEGGVTETVDVPAEDMRLIGDEWFAVIRSETFVRPDVLELPDDEFEAI
jgi:hypothetical protein